MTDPAPHQPATLSIVDDPATVLHPAGRVLWRSANIAQLEIGTRRVIVEGADTEVVRRLLGRSTDAGKRQRGTERSGAVHPSVPPSPHPSAIAALQHRLLDEGFLWPHRDRDVDLRRTPPAPRLAGELTALSARSGEHAADSLNSRRRCSVAVHGSGRAGPHIASVLAAAGVGQVHVLDSAPTRLRHAVPGGVTPGDEGVPLAVAAAAAIRAHAPEVNTAPPAFGAAPDLVILALDEPIDAERRDALHARGCAHLLVQLGIDHGSVGSLVIPGLTSCLRCADLHRLDRDPAWNALAVQLSVPHRSAVASEVALATTIAGIAAMQALCFLDGGAPASIEGSLEMHLPDWRLRRRTWPVHPDCDCMPAATAAT